MAKAKKNKKLPPKPSTEPSASEQETQLIDKPNAAPARPAARKPRAKPIPAAPPLQTRGKNRDEHPGAVDYPQPRRTQAEIEEAQALEVQQAQDAEEELSAKIAKIAAREAELNQEDELMQRMLRQYRRRGTESKFQ